MPKYTATDPTTGMKITLEGDTPPTEADFDAAFAQATKNAPATSLPSPARKTWRNTVADYAQDILPAVGMVGGGVLGGVAGAGEGLATGPGAVVASPALAAVQGAAASGLGYAAGKKGADLIAELLGVKKAQPLASQLLGSAKDIGVGAVMDVAGQSIGPLLKGIGQEIPSDIMKRIALNEKYGTGLSAADLTGSRPLSIAESVMGSTPGGNMVLSGARGRMYDKLVSMRDSLMPSGTLEGYGKDIKDGIDAFNEMSSKQGSGLYDALDATIPASQPIAAPNSVKAARDLLARSNAAGTAWKNKLQGKLEDFAEYESTEPAKPYSTNPPITSPSPNWSALKHIDQTLNDIIGDEGKGFYSNTEVGMARYLKKNIEQDLLNYGQTNPQFYDAYRQAKDFYANRAQILNNPSVRAIIKNKDADAIKYLFNKQDTGAIKNMRLILGNEGMEPVQNAAKLQLLGDAPNTGKFSPTRYATAHSKYDPHVLDELFGQEAGPLQDMADLGRLSGAADKAVGNNSRTALHLGTIGTLLELGHNPLVGAATLAGPAIAAKAYTNPTVESLLVRGVKPLLSNNADTLSQLLKAALLSGKVLGQGD